MTENPLAAGLPADASRHHREPKRRRTPHRIPVTSPRRMATDPTGLQLPEAIHVLSAKSDHLAVDSGAPPLPVGAEIHFDLNYSALLRAMTSPFVAKVMLSAAHAPACRTG